jgi:branched-chain amino acid transport system substrate-binding protein
MDDRQKDMCGRKLLGAAVAAGPVAADTPGVTATEIKIGNTLPYSGPASSYGVSASWRVPTSAW